MRFRIVPAHIGELLPDDGTGRALTITLVLVVAEQLLASVTVTLYCPEAPTTELFIDGF